MRLDADWVTWAAAERTLQLVLDRAIDAGEMVISWKRLPVAEDHKDVFRILGDAGAIDPELSRRLMKAAGLRDSLVHEYGNLDRAKVQKAILHDLHDLEDFAKEISAMVEQDPGP